MIRFALIAVVVLVAAIAVWHPAPSPAPIAVSTSSPATEHRAHVHRENTNESLVYVAGAVVRPGLYHVAPEGRVADAVRLAGGLRPEADPVAVNLAAHVADGDEVAVPRLGEKPVAAVRRRSARTRRTKAAAPVGLVNVNTADAATLARVPGIGRAIAERIVIVRDDEGGYTSLDQLLDVAGVTPSKLDRIRVFLSI